MTPPPNTPNRPTWSPPPPRNRPSRSPPPPSPSWTPPPHHHPSLNPPSDAPSPPQGASGQQKGTRASIGLRSTAGLMAGIVYGGDIQSIGTDH